MMGLGMGMLAATNVSGQINLLQDYKNYYSAPIGVFQGINFREAGFSGMYAIPGTNGKEFWIVTDRGVNIDGANANPSGCAPTYDKIYAFPTYSPKLHHVRLRGDSVQILQTIAIKRPDGTGATGIINPTGFGSTAAEVASTDTVLDCANFSSKVAAKDVWGIDAEGVALDRDGNFWVCEEGGPSVWKINRNGVVIKRYSPYALQPGAEPQDVAIDTVFKYRKNNRGFEGVTVAPNGKVYAMIQSPILYPTKSVGENTRVHRLLEIDPVTNATRMFAYLNDGIIGTGSNQIRLRDWKLGDLAAINDSTFLVIEVGIRGTSDVRRVYKINIASATPVHSGLYGTSTLEALVDSAGLAANGVVPVKKTLFMDILAHGWDPALDKTEGLAILNDSTIFICNDNDYGQYSPLENGIATATSTLSHVVKYGLQGTDKLTGFVPVGTTLTAGVAGPSTAQTPYLVPTVPGATFTSLLTATETVGGYKMCGTPDGLGAFDNGDGTFTLTMNHEFGNTAGVARAHGSTGSFVSKWKINKADLSVISGADLMQSASLWNTATSSYVTYNAAFPSASAAFGRFCSADLPRVSANYNATSGKGTMNRIFMNGEETGNEGRGMAHVVTGPDAGKSYELPYLGKFSWENSVASPSESDTTVVIGMDDATPGQVYVYVGTKQTSGNEIEKAGLTNGRLFGISVSGMLTETNTVVPTAGTSFSLIDLGDVHNMTGSTINANSNIAGVTNFLRPEDGCWDPVNRNDFYFATTNSISSPSRLWKLHFTDPTNPLAGGTVTAVLDGTEGQKMLDNITIDHYGHIMMVEDVGNNVHLGKLWQYTIATDELKQVAVHDSTRFLAGGTAYLTQDEEASGIIDAEEILGPGMFLLVDQAHYGISGEVVEGGQLLAFFNPDSYNAAPEADITGNSIAIVDGDTTPATADNTDFGSVNTGSTSGKTFVITNNGQGSLNISAINFTGANATEYSIAGTPTFPFSIAAGATYTLTVNFAPMAAGTRTASAHIMSNDATEADYDFALSGMGVEIPEINMTGNSNSIADGDMTPGTINNTDFGDVNIGESATRTFVIENNGLGNLNVSGIALSGTAAADYSFTPAPTLPLSVVTAGTYTVTVKFIPSATGSRNATFTVNSNDADEATYDFAITGKGVMPESVTDMNNSSELKLYPNPARNIATLALVLGNAGNVTISVTDMQGKLAMQNIEKQFTAGRHQVELNTASLENGIYNVRVSDGANTTNIKLVVLR